MSTAQRKVAAQRTHEQAPRRRTRRQTDTIGIVFSAAAILSSLALARPGLAGATGEAIATVLRYLFGEGAWAFAGFLGYLGILHINDRRHQPPADLLAGGGMISLCSLWLIHILRVGMVQSVGGPSEFTHGGGIVGATMTSAMTSLVGAGGTWVVMSSLFLGALILLFDTPLCRLLAAAGQPARKGAVVVSRGARNVGRSVKQAAISRRQTAYVEEPFGSRDGMEQDQASPKRARKLASPEEPSSSPGTSLAPYVPPAVQSADAFSQGDAKIRQPVKVKTVVPGTPVQDAAPGTYLLPSLDLLDPPPPPPVRNEAEAQETIQTLETTLSQFNIEAKVVEISRGPTVTRYEIQLAPGIKVSKIVNLADNLAMALAAIDVRVEAPIPGKSAIGIEVPNRKPALVGLRQCLETREFYNAESKLLFTLGVDVAGQPRYADLAKMPHLLIGGSTNSGKSVCLNTLITSLLYRARPDEVKLLLIDPKRVELSIYDEIPHLLYPVVKDVKQAAGIFRWTIKEMEHRYDLFVKAGARNIVSYNEKLPADEKPLPYIVLVVDELADLMMQQGAEVEGHICRLAQLARATGIHLVIATQRPSVDVITGTIKANIGSRIAFAVASHTDSRTILNMNGAERLIGRGDLLYLPMDAPKPTRMQGAFMSEREIDRVVAHLKAQGRPEYTATVATVDSQAASASEGGSEDELWEQTVRLVVNTGHASTSMIQRKFKIGYTRAARLVDMMEEQGIVGSLDGAKPREILINKADLEILFGGVPPMPGSEDPFDD